MTQITIPAKSCGISLGSYTTLKNDTIEQTGDGTCILGLNSRNILIENMVFKSTGKGTFNTAIDLRGADGVEIRNCTFIGWGASAIRAGRFAGCDPTGRMFDNLGDGILSTRHLIVSGCTFIDCHGPVIGFKPGGAQYVEIRHNKFNRFGTYAISAEGELGWTSNVAITDNIIDGGESTSWSHGIYVGEYAFDIKVLRNYVKYRGIRGSAITVSTSPSQGDTPTSDITICDNETPGSGIALMPGNTNIYDVTVLRNISDFVKTVYPDITKNKGKVIRLVTDRSSAK